MNKAKIEFPDSGWIRGNSGVEPDDKQLCVVISDTTGVPMIGMFLKNVILDNYSIEGENYFFDVTNAMEFNRTFGNNVPAFMPLCIVDRWKPLVFPEDVNERVVLEIEKWFEECD